MSIYTIGFTQKTAKTFFTFIKDAKVSTLIDVRLNNVSQLTGFTKKSDLSYFLKELCDAQYMHLSDMAPTKEMLNGYKRNEISWQTYEDKYLNLLSQRNVERSVTQLLLDEACFLCSEHEPHFCHRRLLAEYLRTSMDLDITIKHLF
jgi:uncharacterized protein (DUF488 family)